MRRLQPLWGAFQYGLRGGLVLDTLWDLRMWLRQWRATRRLTRAVRQAGAALAARRNTPWAMLEREEWNQKIDGWLAARGMTRADCKSIRLIEV